MADIILVDTQTMRDTLNKYNTERSNLEDAYEKIMEAKTVLDGCYDGPAYRALCQKLEDIHTNVSTADAALEEAIKGLEVTIQSYEKADTENIKKGESMEVPRESPVYL